MADPKTNFGFELFLLAVLAVLWGSSYFFMKIAVETIPPFSLIAIRVTGASVLLLLVLFWQKEKLPREVRTWGHLLVQSFLNAIGAWTLLAWGQHHFTLFGALRKYQLAQADRCHTWTCGCGPHCRG